MPKQQHQEAYSHYVIAILLGIVGLLIILIFVSLRSQADDTTTTATITNSTTTIDSVTVSTVAGTSGGALGTLTLTENTTTSLYIHGTFTDNNGCEEIATTTGSGFLLIQAKRSGFGTCDYPSDAATDNFTSCIVYQSNNSGAVSTTFSGCTAGGTDATGSYDVRIPVDYNADNTTAGSFVGENWEVTVVPYDGNAYGSTTTAQTFEMGELKAINVTASIDFGELSIGTTSSEQTVTITNTGNSQSVDALISGSNLTCTTGQLYRDFVHYATSSGAAWGNTYEVSETNAAQKIGQNQSGINAATVSSTPATSSTYLKLELPTPTSTVYGGSCSGTLTFTAN